MRQMVVCGAIVTEARDPLLAGMAAERLNDPVHRAAYRDCMRRRLGSPRR